MTYSRFKIGFTRSHKVSQLSDAAFRLWTSSIDHCREQLTDGLVNPAALTLIPRGGLKVGWTAAIVKELVKAGLWEDLGDRLYRIHDFLDWQDAATRVREKQGAARDRMRRVRANSIGNSGANKARTERECSPEVPEKFVQHTPLSLSGSPSLSADLQDPDQPDQVEPPGARDAGPVPTDQEVFVMARGWDPGFGLLMGAGVSEATYRAALPLFWENHLGDSDTLVRWRKRLRVWVMRDHASGPPRRAAERAPKPRQPNSGYYDDADGGDA